VKETSCAGLELLGALVAPQSILALAVGFVGSFAALVALSLAPAEILATLAMSIAFVGHDCPRWSA
jgi:hypothetical protein